MTVSLLDRCGDIVFYTADKSNTEVEVYYKDLNSVDTNFDGSNLFCATDSISNVIKVGDGYAFITANNALLYKELNGQLKNILGSDTTFDILFEENGWIYYSSSTEINRISVIDKTIENVVTMTNMISGQYGYSDGYIYFFAQVEDSSNEDSDSTDENYYLYRVSSDGSKNYQLLGKTK